MVCVICGCPVVVAKDKVLKIEGGGVGDDYAGRKDKVESETDHSSLSTTLSTYQHEKNVLQWKVSLLESLSMLFGLPVNHALIYRASLEPCQEDCKCEQHNQLSKHRLLTCSQCLEDVSNVHYIFWQLHNLERKLIRIQDLIYQRLVKNHEEQLVDLMLENESTTESEATRRSLFEEINLCKYSWPQRSSYVTRWTTAQQFSASLVSKLEAQLNLKKEIFQSHDDVVEEQCFDKEENDSGANLIYNGEPVMESGSDAVNLPPEKTIEMKKVTRTKRSSTSKAKSVHTKRVLKFLCTVDPDICSRTYSKKKELTRHIKQFHKGRTHICDHEGCVKKFLSEVSLKKHKTKAHDGAPSKRKCDFPDCLETFDSRGALNTHKFQMHGNQINKNMSICEVCGLSVLSKKMKAHQRSHYDDRDRNICGLCSLELATADELEIHENLHDQMSPSTPFTCVVAICLRVFPNSVDLKSHVINTHLTHWLECQYCGVKKPNDFFLQRHIRIHQRKQEKSYMCDECPKTFFNESTLAIHKRDYHAGIKHRCKTCSKEFSIKKSYIRHLVTHKSEKPFNCEICTKSFSYKHALKNHEAIHSGTKSFECHLCGKRFKQENNLRQHLRTQKHRSQVL